MKRSAKLDASNCPPSKKQKLDIKYPAIPIDGKNLLSVLLYPLNIDEFMKNYWTKKYYHVSIDNQDRVKDLLNGPFPFHLKTLLQDTASQKIHVWMKTKNDSSSNKDDKHDKLLSFTVEDDDSALSSFHCGGSLYFRSSQELSDIFITELMKDLGIGIGSNYNDGNQRGEIEVFVSHKNHLTSWHTDFQHNFTIQLFGHKRWYLLPISNNNGSFSNVYRGYTPHYSNNNYIDLNSKECQIKLHKSQYPKFNANQWKEFDDLNNKKYCDEIKIIDLKPGSTLYFPSGMWHKVETISDKSLSINLSIIPMTYGQLINNAINHYMAIDPIFREPILHNNNNNNKTIINKLSNKIQVFLSNINKYPSCLIPPSFSNDSLSSNNTVCIEMVDFDENDQDDDKYKNTIKPPEITINSNNIIINPLSVIIPFNDIYPQKQSSQINKIQDLGEKFATFDDLETKYDDNEDDYDEDDADDNNNQEPVLKQYILHINFGEADSFASVSRVILQCKNELTIKIIDWICDLRKKKKDTLTNNEMITFSAKDITTYIDSKASNIFHVLRVLTFFGFLSLKN